MKIAVVGAGPSGLYLSILVKKKRPDWQVTVVEQNTADSTFGFGVVLADSGLNRLKVADEETYNALLEKMKFTQYQIITQRDEGIKIKRPNSGGGAIARIDLLGILQRIARQYGVEIRHEQRVESLDDLAALGLADADLVVGADGINSVVRRDLEPQFGTTHSSLTNHFAWYGVGKAFPTSALVFRQYHGGAFVGHYYPYALDRSTFVAECDHATWQSLGMEGMTQDQRQHLLEKVFAPELGGHAFISNNSTWRQFPVIHNKNWFTGKVVLIGDAQTSAHFSIGSGTRIAMEDSIALAAAFVEGDDAPGNNNSDNSAFVAQRLQQFADTRGPQKSKLIGASERSYMWYEDIAKWMNAYSPTEFVYAFMMRTGRLSDERLANDYPELMQQIQAQRQRDAVGAGAA